MTRSLSGAGRRTPRGTLLSDQTILGPLLRSQAWRLWLERQSMGWVLNVGSGPIAVEAYVRELGSRKILNLDKNLEVVGSSGLQAEASHIPLADRSVSAVLAINVTPYEQNIHGFWAETFRVLKFGGPVLVVEPIPNAIWARLQNRSVAFALRSLESHLEFIYNAYPEEVMTELLVPRLEDSVSLANLEIWQCIYARQRCSREVGL